MRIQAAHGRDLIVGEGQTRLMGVVNVTPDSFSDGGAFLEPERAVAHALTLAAEGADILDIGGESTRPGYAPVPPTAQIERIVPVIRGVRRESQVPISVDTTHGTVAAAALEAGADWINDTTALQDDPDLMVVIAEADCPIVLMHRFVPPRDPATDEPGPAIVQAIANALAARAQLAIDHGVDPQRIILDPGLGFGTLFEDNLLLMADFGPLQRLPYPWLFGPSRKSFVGQMTGRPVTERLHGTAAAVAILAMQGVEVLRVHDVAAMVDVVKVADALRNTKAGTRQETATNR